MRRKLVLELFCSICIVSSPLAAIHQTGIIAAQEPVAQGLHDLIVYDPGAHERGLPSPQLVPSGEGLKVDIPPSIHVHRYYYSGDKEIQGPIISGGPTVVVANHPKTGKRMYVDVVLPSGAPRISYDKHGITYVYPDQRVTVAFQRFLWNCDKAKIVNRSGQGVIRAIHDANKHVADHVCEGFANSAFIQSSKEAVGDTGDFLHGVKSSVGTLSAKGVDGIKSMTNMVPGVTYLKSLREQEPESEYANSVRAAAHKKDRTEVPFVETNR